MTNVCPAIHHGFCITAYKTLDPCCSSHNAFAQLSHIDNIVDYWHSSDTEFEKARINEITGEKIWPACIVCQNTENIGIESRRQRFQKRYLYADKDFSLQNPRDILYFDISLGNTCNQKCIMCSSSFSSQWIKDDQEFVEKFPWLKDKRMILSKSWSLSLKQIDEIVELITEKTEIIEFKGGEPMYDRKFYYFVEKALKKNDKVKIKVCTNGTYFNKKSIEFINSIPNFDVEVSVDGIEKMYEWIRGYNWKEFEKSFHYLLENSIHTPIISFTTSKYNLNEYEKFYNYIADMSKKYNKRIDIHFSNIVQGPIRYQSPEYATKPEIKEAIRQLNIINNNPRNLKVTKLYYSSIEILRAFLKKKCLKFKIVNQEKLKNIKADIIMKEVRGYSFTEVKNDT